MAIERIHVYPDHEGVVNVIVIAIVIIRNCPPPGAIVVIGQEILAQERVESAQVRVALQFLNGVAIGLAAKRLLAHPCLSRELVSRCRLMRKRS